jgi:CRP/FNR family transcriptional regulator
MPSPCGLELVESCVGCRRQRTGFFCNLPRHCLAAFEKIKFAYLLPKGSTLFVAGQMPGGVFLLCAGKVKLYVPADLGRARIIRIAGPGEVLGLHSCIASAPHEFTAETLQPCQIAAIRREDFLRWLHEDRDACWKTAQTLSRGCQMAYDILRGLVTRHSAREKLARLILDLAATGKPGRRGVRIKVSLTHQEIAQAMGMSRGTVWRKLTELRRHRIASMRRSTLVVRDLAALERLTRASAPR